MLGVFGPTIALLAVWPDDARGATRGRARGGLIRLPQAPSAPRSPGRTRSR
jgi:hypothetical protein